MDSLDYGKSDSAAVQCPSPCYTTESHCRMRSLQHDSRSINPLFKKNYETIQWQELQTTTSIQNDFIIKNDMKESRRLDDKWNNFLCTLYSALTTCNLQWNLNAIHISKKNHFCFVVWHVISISREWKRKNNRKVF